MQTNLSRVVRHCFILFSIMIRSFPASAIYAAQDCGLKVIVFPDLGMF